VQPADDLHEPTLDERDAGDGEDEREDAHDGTASHRLEEVDEAEDGRADPERAGEDLQQALGRV
jgi:hypothetical protein